jgi:nucleoside-diphosphate-sugar epimerase
MKILVTGGAGYIGSILTPLLLNNNYNVTVVDNFMYKQLSLSSVCINQKLKIINGDIRDNFLMKNLVKEHDMIIPLGGIVGAPLCEKDPILAENTNHKSIIDMLDLCSKDQAIIMPTTNSAYGSGDKNNYCDENSPLNPISKYAIDKVKIEKKLMERDNSISFRLATVFGMSPRMRLDLLVNDFVHRAVKDGYLVIFEGHFKRNYIHVRDVADAFLFAINNFTNLKSEIFNVGLSNANLSKIELCKKIQNHVDKFVFFEEKIKKDPDQRNYIVSNDKIEKAGFKPKISIDEGIIELIKGLEYINNRLYGNF